MTTRLAWTDATTSFILADVLKSVDDHLDDNPVLRRALVLALFAFGAVPQIAHLLTRGAFWGDEAALALNIGPRGFFEMGRPFIYYQACPWLAMVAIKTSTLVFGQTEFAYRLVPCLAALGTLPATYVVGRRAGGTLVGLIAMLFVGTSAEVVYYAAEHKQYTLDALVAAVLLILFLRVLKAPGRIDRTFVALVVFGALAGWISLASLFVNGAICAALGAEALKNRRGARWIGALAGFGAVCVLSFLVHFNLFVAASDLATSKDVAKYWQHSFAPFPPDSLEDLRWYAGKYFYVFESPLSFGQRYIGGLAFLLGVGMFLRRKKAFVLLGLAGPWLLAIAASMMDRYPPEGRLMLFMVPSITVVVAFGAVTPIRDRHTTLQILGVVLVMALTLPHLDQTWRHVTKKPGPDIADALDNLGRRYRPGDTVYMAEWDIAQIWDFYRPRTGLPADGYVRVRHIRQFDEAGRFPNLPKFAEAIFGGARVWILAPITDEVLDPKETGRSAENYAAFITRYLDRHGGAQLDATVIGNHALYLYDLRGAVTPVGPDATANAAERGIRSR